MKKLNRILSFSLAWVNAYADGDLVSIDARAAMEWAVGCGIMQGSDSGLLSPQNIITRAELAQMILNFVSFYNTATYA